MVLERLPIERIDEVRELWLSLRDQHATVTPDWRPMRSDQDTWAQRRAQYVKWAAQDGTFCLVARGDDGAALGYTFVTASFGGSANWQIDRIGCIETLSVAPDVRGRGIGAQLLHAAEDALFEEHGIEVVDIGVVAPNVDAVRFYEREGYPVSFHVMQRRTRR